VESATTELRQLLLTLAPVLLLVAGGIGYWVSSRALAPVDRMTRAARGIGVSDLSARLPVPAARDEVSRLAEAWNEMLARLEESVARIQQFTADAAHELRTPLTALRTTAELALRRERSASEYRRSIQHMLTVSERMTGLVDSLVALARGDIAARTSSSGDVIVCDVVRAVEAEMAPMFAEKGVRLVTRLPETPLVASGETAGVRRMLTSLVENALAYTEEGGSVEISVRCDDSAVVVEVADTGCGIPPESLQHVFDRFYRVDPSRNRRSGGHGLGLAIVQQIAVAHGRPIEVESTLGKGTRFWISL
jgi:heavy metal sensor kinase